jgi:hypothetical protein
MYRDMLYGYCQVGRTVIGFARRGKKRYKMPRE